MQSCQHSGVGKKARTEQDAAKLADSFLAQKCTSVSEILLEHDGIVATYQEIAF
jgi:hypothetical protein